MTNPTFLNVRQAAAELGMAPRTLSRRIAQGHIEASKIGTGRTSAYVIDAAEIERVKAAKVGA